MGEVYGSILSWFLPLLPLKYVVFPAVRFYHRVLEQIGLATAANAYASMRGCLPTTLKELTYAWYSSLSVLLGAV